MLNICGRCTTAFAVGCDHCPQCGNADYYPEGSMPKVTRHGGPSVFGEARPAEAEVEATETEPATDETRKPLATEYDALLLADLREACRDRGLATSGNKAELVTRLEAADAERAQRTQEPEPVEGVEDPDATVEPGFKSVF